MLDKKRYAYIIESNRFITKAEIIKETKQFTTVRFENGGCIRLSNKRLYNTEKEAIRVLAHKKKNRIIINN